MNIESPAVINPITPPNAYRPIRKKLTVKTHIQLKLNIDKNKEIHFSILPYYFYIMSMRFFHARICNSYKCC